MYSKLFFQNNINAKHKNLVNVLKEKIRIYNTKIFYPHYDIPIYFSSFYNSTGLFHIQKILRIKKNIFLNIFYILKDFFYSLNYDSLKVYGHSKKILEDKIVFTWGFKKNFLKNGSFNDKYFNINSRKCKDVAWIILFLDKEVPKVIDKNIFIIQPKKQKKLNFVLLIKHIILNIKFIFKDFQYFLFSISSHNFLSKKFIKLVKEKLSETTKSFLIVYESQPFQNELIKFAKKNNIKTAGYIHFPPLALPVHLLKKKYSPEKLFINGKDQKKCFQKLGWKSKDLLLVKSSRFLKNIKKNFVNKIFLPTSIKSKNIILKNLEYLIAVHKFDFTKFIIQNHPVSLNSKTHKDLIFKIEKLKKKYLNSNFVSKSTSGYSIFIGSSGTIIEALERKVKVIQITEIPIMDCYSNYFWHSIRSKKINNFIYTYKILKQKNLINLGLKSNNLNTYFDKF